MVIEEGGARVVLEEEKSPRKKKIPVEPGESAHKGYGRMAVPRKDGRTKSLIRKQGLRPGRMRAQRASAGRWASTGGPGEFTAKLPIYRRVLT